MGVRITQMDPLQGALEKNDLFEIARRNGSSTSATFSVTADQIANYYKLRNNGGFMNTTTKGLDEFRHTDVGTYFWSGNPGVSGLPSQGMLEVVGFKAPADADPGDDLPIYQRLTTGSGVWTRSRAQSVWSTWSELDNKNGCYILTGEANSAEVTYADNYRFNTPPRVIITPLNPDGQYVYVANAFEITESGFKVRRYQSSLTAAVTNTKSTKTESSGTTITTESTDVTRGAWDNGEFTYHWVAIAEM